MPPTGKKRNFDQLFRQIYYTPSQPGAYSSKSKLFKIARGKNEAVTMKDVDEWFKRQLVTVHKGKRKYKRPPVLMKYPNVQHQCDLMDTANVARHNDGARFILTNIDVFSRRAWAVPLKNKSGPTVARALKGIWAMVTPKILQTDRGVEFYNAPVRELMNKLKIEHFSSTNFDTKASIVERFNRNMREKLQKYMTANNTYRFVDKLPEFVAGYNATEHSSTGFPPDRVGQGGTGSRGDPETNILVRQKLYGGAAGAVRPFKHSIGDFCRVLSTKKTFEKGYAPNFSEEIFQIVQRKRLGSSNVYKLVDLKKNEIASHFPEGEIQVVKIPENFRIEKVIKTRTRGGKKQYFVSWAGYEPDQNSWIDESQLV